MGEINLKMENPVTLIVGSLHYDIIVETDQFPKIDETAVGKKWFPKFGGKGGNQAVAASKIGHARMIGALGDDDFGRFMREKLRFESVDDRHIRDLKNSGTGMSVAIVNDDGDYTATIVSGANLEIEASWIDDEEAWDNVRVLVLQNEIDEDINFVAAKYSKDRGISVLLNAAPACDLNVDFSALIDVLVVNAVEAAMMANMKSVNNRSDASLAAEHLRKNFKNVIVTCGGNGLVAIDEAGELIKLPASSVERVVSTHGAGDCFTGVLAASLANGESLFQACKIASDAAAKHVSGA